LELRRGFFKIFEHYCSVWTQSHLILEKITF
jgi:hypothetical protein